MSQQTLAVASGVSHSTIKDFESNKRTPIANNLAAIERVLSKHGIAFVEADGKIGIFAPANARRTSSAQDNLSEGEE